MLVSLFIACFYTTYNAHDISNYGVLPSFHSGKNPSSIKLWTLHALKAGKYSARYFYCKYAMFGKFTDSNFTKLCLYMYNTSPIYSWGTRLKIETFCHYICHFFHCFNLALWIPQSDPALMRVVMWTNGHVCLISSKMLNFDRSPFDTLDLPIFRTLVKPDCLIQFQGLCKIVSFLSNNTE